MLLLAAVMLPIYRAAPRMSGMRRYIDDLGLRERCISFVERNGGASFFQNNGWRRILFGIVREFQSGEGLNDGFETRQDQRLEIKDDLQRSKELIEDQLPGKEVGHLSYPWGVGSPLAIKISKEVGYITNFWGKVDNRYSNYVGGDSFRIARMGGDLLRLLPGSGRSPLRTILTRKVRSRLTRASPYFAH